MFVQRLAKLFPKGAQPKSGYTHASNPFAIRNKDHYQTFFSARDRQNRSHVFFVDIAVRDSAFRAGASSGPVLSPGELGLFDDSGVTVGSLVRDRGQLLLYYLGWNLGVTVPWRNAIGVAVFDLSKRRFERIHRAPILDRADEDPFCLSYPHVMKESGVFRMWYGSHLKWGRSTEDMRHVIKVAESRDGIHWRRVNKICIPLEGRRELGVARPHVIKENGIYRMWYSRRNKNGPYRLGYAESKNGIEWKRKDAEIRVGHPNGAWDRQMICYPFVFDHDRQRYMFYNGNGYGRTGFGLARVSAHANL